MRLNASQNPIAEMRYKAWGEQRTLTGSFPTTYRFTGQRLDEGIGLYFYNARYYDHLLGRFVQADTIVPSPGNPQSLNRYSYVLNNPLRYVDPSGRCAADPSEDPECWAVYNQVSKKWGSGIPDDLWRWSIMQLIRLRIWLTAGIRFTADPAGAWTSANVADVMTALDRTRSALGAGAYAALGLSDLGILTFHKYAAGRPDEGAIGGLYVYQNVNLIYLWLLPGSAEQAVQTITHELGHRVDWRLGGDRNTADSPWSTNAPLWRRDARIGGPAVSQYAMTNTWEDFAETFTWYVEHQTRNLGSGGYTSLNPQNPFNDPSDARFTALIVALGAFGPVR